MYCIPGWPTTGPEYMQFIVVAVAGAARTPMGTAARIPAAVIETSLRILIVSPNGRVVRSDIRVGRDAPGAGSRWKSLRLQGGKAVGRQF